jgi:triacylglycerol lipase
LAPDFGAAAAFLAHALAGIAGILSLEGGNGMNVVLVHGILGFSHLAAGRLHIDYFAGVAQELRRNGAKVIAPTLDPTAGVDRRADMLHEAIQAALEQGELLLGEPIRLIAHSMGGLDSRRLIAKNRTFSASGKRSEIDRLATIATPHHGTPIADLLVPGQKTAPGFLARLEKGFEHGLAKMLATLNISLDGLHDLTSASTNLFNQTNTNDASVKYHSYAGKGRLKSPHASVVLSPGQAFLTFATGPNDGLVPVSSAQWGDFDPDQWPCDHADEIGHDLDSPLAAPSAEIIARYIKIVSRF